MYPRRLSATALRLGDDSGHSDLIKKLAGMVMKHEGSYDAINRNTDGAGVSIGIFQWPQRTGGLGLILTEYQRAEPRLFARIFGTQWQALLEHTRARRMDPLDGRRLWEEPWVSRFRLAGQQPVFQAVQDRLAEGGEFMRSAFSSAKVLGLTSERVLAVTLDTAVSQGPQFAEQVAWSVRKQLAGKVLSVQDLLQAYLRGAIAHFRRTEPPTKPPKSSHLSWKAVGQEWHIFAGQLNLYRNILNRRSKYIQDPTLSDEPI